MSDYEEWSKKKITRLQSVWVAARDEAERLQAENTKLWGWVNEAEQIVMRMRHSPWLLRKQAEAVETFSSEYGSPLCGEGRHLISLAQKYAQRLRQQADELERQNE